MKIEYIQYPFVFTDSGERIDIENIKGIPRVGAELSKINIKEYEVQAVTSDSECVNGVCPVR